MIGMTSVPRVQFGVIFSSSSPFSRVTVISVISRVVVILGTETFIVVAGIVSSSSSCGLSAVRTCEDVPKKRMLPWYSRIALWSWRSITILSPLPWGDWPRCVSKSKLKKKRKSLPLVKLPGTFTQTASSRALGLEGDKYHLEH